MDSLISTFHIDWKIIIAQMVNFAIVFFVLYRFAIKPLSKLMIERQGEIKKGLDDAEQNKKILEDTQKSYDDALSQARKEGVAIIAEAKREATKKKDELVKIAENDVATMLANGKQILESEKQKMIADAKKELASIVMQSTEKVLGSVIDSDIREKISKALIKDI